MVHLYDDSWALFFSSLSFSAFAFARRSGATTASSKSALSFSSQACSKHMPHGVQGACIHSKAAVVRRHTHCLVHKAVSCEEDINVGQVTCQRGSLPPMLSKLY